MKHRTFSAVLGQIAAVAMILMLTFPPRSESAFVDNGTLLDLNGGTLTLTATSTTKSVADAKPLEDGGTVLVEVVSAEDEGPTRAGVGEMVKKASQTLEKSLSALEPQ